MKINAEVIKTTLALFALAFCFVLCADALDPYVSQAPACDCPCGPACQCGPDCSCPR
jgi:hypothetical protein